MGTRAQLGCGETVSVLGREGLGGVNSVSVTRNIITQAQNGIDLGCNVDNSVTSNTITAIHSVGLANVPSGADLPNIYYNVPTLYSICP